MSLDDLDALFSQLPEEGKLVHVAGGVPRPLDPFHPVGPGHSQEHPAHPGILLLEDPVQLAGR